MSATKLIKQIMIERNISVKDLAEKLDIKPQSMSNKFHRDSFSFNDVVKIADILDCDIKIVTRDSGKTFK